MRRRVKVARGMQASLKRFEGWEPSEVTVVTEHTAEGWPKRWVTTREVEWDGRERSLMLALAYFEDTLCPKCRQPLAETMDPMTDPDLPEAPKRWIADGPDECFCCKALVRAERVWSDAQAENVKNDGEDSSPWTVHTPLLVTKPVRHRQ